MKTIVALEKIIDETKNRIKHSKKQLELCDSNELKLSNLEYASTENSIEKDTKSLKEFETKYKEISSLNQEDYENSEKLKEMIKRKNYYKYQKKRLKRQNSNETDRFNIIAILDELPEDCELEDKIVVLLAKKSLSLKLIEVDTINKKYQEIKKTFNSKLKNIVGENINQLGGIESNIYILVTQFHFFYEDLLNSYKELKLNFKGMPKYQDWWIKELWYSHQAYFGLYKWKEIIYNLCKSDEQKELWERLFTDWLNIKKSIRNKSKLGYEYHLAFDDLMEEYTYLVEELNHIHLESMETIIKKITKNEDFIKLKNGHSITTSYLEYKQKEKGIN